MDASRVAARWLRGARPIRIDRAEVGRLVERFRQNFEYLAKYSEDEPLGENPDLMNDVIELPNVVGEPESIIVALLSTSTPGGRDVLGGGFGRITHGPHAGRPVVKIEINGDNTARWFSRMLPRQLGPILMHELTHALDKIHADYNASYFKSRDRDPTLPASLSEVDPVAYFNDPAEVRAYMRQLYEELAADVRRLEKQTTKPPWASTLSGIVNHLLKHERTWAMISPHLTRANRNIILKGVMTAFQDEGVRVAARTDRMLPPEQWQQGEFLRIGDWPADERSRNFNVKNQGGIETLGGVSAYEYYYSGRIYWVDDLRPSDSMYSLFRQVAEGKRKVYVIRATRVGTGPDGEPLVRWIRKLGELKPTEIGYQGTTADKYAPRKRVHEEPARV